MNTLNHFRRNQFSFFGVTQKGIIVGTWNFHQMLKLAFSVSILKF